MDFLSTPFWFIPALAAAAFLYAQVGHGGASAYLALATLAGATPTSMRPSALVLNLFVAGLSTAAFTRRGHQRWDLLGWLVLGSMPAAWLAARLPLDPLTLKRLLGVLLALAALRLWLPQDFGAQRSGRASAPRPWALICIGLLLGTVAGLTGVGGGIYLSPLLLVLGWATAKETAALSAAFIVINSASALLSLAGQGLPSLPWTWVAACVAGGGLGAWFGSARLPEQVLRRVLALVLLLAAIKLLF